MKKGKAVDLLASICLCIGSVINVINNFIDVHFVISLIAVVLLSISVVLWIIVLMRIKSK